MSKQIADIKNMFRDIDPQLIEDIDTKNQKKSIEFVIDEGKREILISRDDHGHIKTMYSKFSGLTAGDLSKKISAILLDQKGDLPDYDIIDGICYMTTYETREAAKKWYQQNYLGDNNTNDLSNQTVEIFNQPILKLEEEKQSHSDKKNKTILDGKQEERYNFEPQDHKIIPADLINESRDVKDHDENNLTGQFSQLKLNNISDNIKDQQPQQVLENSPHQGSSLILIDNKFQQEHRLSNPNIKFLVDRIKYFASLNNLDTKIVTDLFFNNCESMLSMAGTQRVNIDILQEDAQCLKQQYLQLKKFVQSNLKDQDSIKDYAKSCEVDEEVLSLFLELEPIGNIKESH
jgi:hypothetical protein